MASRTLVSPRACGGFRRASLVLATALVAQGIFGPSTARADTASFTPVQIQTAYNFSPLYTAPSPINGTGQTIAIIDFGYDPTLQSDLNAFDSAYGLPSATVTAESYTGASLATNQPTLGADTDIAETSLDVEWAHAIAPGASILVLEADELQGLDLNQSNFNSEVATAVATAKSAGASVVSMSFGTPETSTQTSSSGGNPLNDTIFNAPGVTFVASAGDSGAAPQYPASSPYVMGVGGTVLSVGALGTRTSETAWSYSGGGQSSVEPEPGYQSSAQSTGARTIPDVAYAAVDGAGDAFNIYFTPTQNASEQGFTAGKQTNTYYGGTSAGAPQWAALVALVDQGLAAEGQSPLSTTTLLTDLYTIYQNPTEYAADFYDITSGSNGNPAGPGYDEVTGLGVPNADALVTDLIAMNSVPEPAAALMLSIAAGGCLARRRRGKA